MEKSSKVRQANCHLNPYSIHSPQTISEIQGFLECLNGVGLATAKKIVKAFGKDTLQVLEQDPDRLLQISGITASKLKGIVLSFNEKSGMQRLISFLYSIEISATHAAKIHKKYGSGAVAIRQKKTHTFSQEKLGEWDFSLQIRLH
ncbi:MAG: hypothetical protein HC942_26330 [Microcoleus sp. SU_5_6]|nr:hypothetical protein [Microcoleus sp. SU_5_6]